MAEYRLGQGDGWKTWEERQDTEVTVRGVARREFPYEVRSFLPGKLAPDDTARHRRSKSAEIAAPAPPREAGRTERSGLERSASPTTGATEISETRRHQEAMSEQTRQGAHLASAKSSKGESEAVRQACTRDRHGQC